MKYIVSFGSGMTGLSPTVSIFVRLDTLAPVTAPTPVTEIPNSGCYVFEYTPNPAYDIFFQVDGGAGLPDSDRYKTGVVSANDGFLDASVAGVATAVNTVSTRQGASTDVPGTATVFGQIYASRNTLQGDIADSMGTVADGVTRLLGLSKENSSLDQTGFDAKNNLTTARFRIFASKAAAEAGTSPTAIYRITATYVAGTNNIETYSMVREA